MDSVRILETMFLGKRVFLSALSESICVSVDGVITKGISDDYYWIEGTLIKWEADKFIKSEVTPLEVILHFKNINIYIRSGE